MTEVKAENPKVVLQRKLKKLSSLVVFIEDKETQERVELQVAELEKLLKETLFS